MEETYSLEYYLTRERARTVVRNIFVLLISLTQAYLLFRFPPGYLALIFSLATLTLVVCWHKPVVGFAGLLALTLLFEQFKFADFTPLTLRVPFLENISSFTSLSFLAMNPFEVLLLTIALALIARVSIERRKWHSNALLMPIMIFGACLTFFAGYGLATGGEFKVILWELRALFYLLAIILILPQLISSERDVKGLLWISIVVIGIKAIQGIWRYTVVLGGDLNSVQAITAHEDALFFISLVILLIAMLVFDGPRAQKVLIGLLMPAILTAFVLTDRRVAYVALAVGLVVLGALVARLPHKRKLVVSIGLPFMIIGLLYLGAFWNNSGPLGRSAQAIKSIVQPSSTSDIQSNQYRRVEEMNLMDTIKSSPFIGIGFGKPYKMTGQLSNIDFSLAAYIPHNEILWLWVKMGTFGFAVFWFFAGSILVRGCLVYRRVRNPYFKAVALTAVVLLVMQIVVSYADLQLTFYRNMVYLGTFVAILLRLEDLDQDGQSVGT